MSRPVQAVYLSWRIKFVAVNGVPPNQLEAWAASRK